jgi:hypothetical protein
MVNLHCLVVELDLSSNIIIFSLLHLCMHFSFDGLELLLLLEHIHSDFLITVVVLKLHIVIIKPLDSSYLGYDFLDVRFLKCKNFCCEFISMMA